MLLLQSEMLPSALVAASHRADSNESVGHHALATLRLLARHLHQLPDGSADCKCGRRGHERDSSGDASSESHSESAASDELIESGENVSSVGPSAIADALADLLLHIGDSSDSPLCRQAAATLDAINKLPSRSSIACSK